MSDAHGSTTVQTPDPHRTATPASRLRGWWCLKTGQIQISRESGRLLVALGVAKF
jgi:hypothetical protein